MWAAIAKAAGLTDDTTNGQVIRQSETFIVSKYVPSPPKIKKYYPVGNGQCVDFVKYNGFQGYSGNAYTWKRYVIKGAFGFPGDAIILDEGPFQHLALIIGNEGGYNLAEQNYEGKYIVSYRTIPFDYSKIVGVIPKP